MSQNSNGKASKNPQQPQQNTDADREFLRTLHDGKSKTASVAVAETVNVQAAQPPEPPQTVAAPTRPVAPTPPPVAQEKVWLVRFHAKSHPNDTDDVALPVNGEIFLARRDEECPCPERFLEAADHAMYPHYKQEPGKQRKIAAFIRRFPYTRGSESSWEEYQKWKTQGTKRNQEHLDKWGMERPTEG